MTKRKIDIAARVVGAVKDLGMSDELGGLDLETTPGLIDSFYRKCLRHAGIPLRRGMTLENGWLVLHGETGDMPRCEGDRITIVNNVGQTHQLHWQGETDTWHFPDGDVPMDGVLPDVEQDQTWSLVFDEVKQLQTGENLTHAMLSRDFLTLTAPALLKLRVMTPEQRRVAWDGGGADYHQAVMKLIDSMHNHDDEVEVEINGETVKITKPDLNIDGPQIVGHTSKGEPIVALSKDMLHQLAGVMLGGPSGGCDIGEV